MEKRVMLSSTGVDMDPAEMPVAQFSFDSALVGIDRSPAEEKLVELLAEHSEGGYLQLFYTGNVDVVSSGVSYDSLGVGGSTVGDGHLIDMIGSNVQADFPNLTSETFDDIRNQFDFDGLDIYGGGLEPANILDTQSSPETHSNTETNVALHNSGSGELSEGGPISIPVILASRESIGGAQFERATGAKTLAADESTRTEVMSHSPSDSLVLNVISAEWARAMVLETAGGETDGAIPMDAVHQGAAGRSLEANPNTRSGEPLPSEQPGEGAEKTAAPKSLSAPTSQAASGDANLPKSFLDATREGNISLDAGVHAIVGTGRQDAHAVAASGAGASEARTPNLIVDAAFERVGESNESLLQSLADASWRRPLSAAPLLMMLALERISAGNSRRSNREITSGPVPRRKLHRSGDAAERA